MAITRIPNYRSQQSNTLAKQPIALQEQPQQEAGFIERNIVAPTTAFLGAIPSALQAGIDIIGLPSQRAGEPEITALHGDLPGTIKHQRELYSKARNLKPESLNPQNPVERGIEFVAGDLPLELLTGGLSTGAKAAITLKRVGSTAAGAALGEEVLGAPGALIGALTGPALFKGASNKLKDALSKIKGEDIYKAPGGIRNYLESAKEAAYDASEKAFKSNQAVGDASKVKKTFNRFRDAGLKGNQTKEGQNVIKRVDEVLNRIKNDHLKLQDAIDYKQTFNRMGYEGNYTNLERGIFKKAGYALNEFIRENGPQFGQAYKDYKIGERLTKSLNASQEAGNLFQELFKPSLFSKNGVIKSIFKIGIGGAGSIPGVEQTKFFFRHPEAREYYGKILKSLVNDDKVAAANAMRKFVQIAQEDEKSTQKSLKKTKQLESSGKIKRIPNYRSNQGSGIEQL